MSRIRGMDTSIEMAVRRELWRRGYRYRKNVMSLPGRPDVVFPGARVVVFVDGDFWHGYRYPAWKRKLSAYWDAKLRRNRARDQRNFAKLRRAGWRVLRVWEHDVKRDLGVCVDRIAEVLAESPARRGTRLRLPNEHVVRTGEIRSRKTQSASESGRKS